jgi:ABC-type phosphate transport system substrate-binding protein
MKHLRSILTAGILVAGSHLAANAADVKIIANESVTASEISTDDLKRVFLQTKSSVGDAHVSPVLEKDGAAHEAFLKEYIGKSDAALSTYYRSLVFTGKGAVPKTFASDEEMAAYVAKTKGAIGYVGASSAAAGAKVLAVK